MIVVDRLLQFGSAPESKTTSLTTTPNYGLFFRFTFRAGATTRLA